MGDNRIGMEAMNIFRTLERDVIRTVKGQPSGTRDVFLVEKSPGAKPEWVEQDEFGGMPNYDNWRSLERRTIDKADALPTSAGQAWRPRQ